MSPTFYQILPILYPSSTCDNILHPPTALEPPVAHIQWYPTLFLPSTDALHTLRPLPAMYPPAAHVQPMFYRPLASPLPALYPPPTRLPPFFYPAFYQPSPAPSPASLRATFHRKSTLLPSFCVLIIRVLLTSPLPSGILRAASPHILPN